jgi:hypothetical protein
MVNAMQRRQEIGRAALRLPEIQGTLTGDVFEVVVG